MPTDMRAQPDGKHRKVGIAVARFNEVVTERLLQGALLACKERGVADTDIYVAHVPGAFELPQAALWRHRCKARLSR